jgi:hypothetical protein
VDNNDTSYRDFIRMVAEADAEAVLAKDIAYGASWKKRGGPGAFMVSIRKADRLEEQAKACGYDVFKAIARVDEGGESAIESIRDLRRYLILIEAEAYAQGILAIQDPFPLEEVSPLYEGDPHDDPTGAHKTQ